jgi:hypothetical protein
VIPQLAVNYQNSIQLAATAPIRADYAKGVLSLQRSTIRGTGTEVTFQASIPAANDAPASMLVQGSVDLRLAQLVSPDITSAGELRFDIDSNGRRSDPNVQGQIRIVNASFATAGAPLGLQNGNGVLTLTQDRLDVTQFNGKVGGGPHCEWRLCTRRCSSISRRCRPGSSCALRSKHTRRSTRTGSTGSYENALERGRRRPTLHFDFDIQTS